MSTHELEAKCRELRQLQALIEEAQDEAEAIKDAIKAEMGQDEVLRAGEYTITWKPVKSARMDVRLLKQLCLMWLPALWWRTPSAASVWHEEGPHIPAAKQEDMKPRNYPGGSKDIIPPCPLQCQRRL